MADLIDRLAGTDPTRPKIPVHQFCGAFVLYVAGLKTKPQIATYFDLQGAEATQATTLGNAVDAQTGVANKIAYCLRVEAVAAMLELPYPDDTFYHNPDGTVNKAAVQADLGI